MENPLRQYIYEIGMALGKLGYELCQQAENHSQPMSFHGVVADAQREILLILHNLNAVLDAWRKEMLAKNGKIQLPAVFEGTDGVDVETAYCAVLHVLHSKCCDNWGTELSFTEELRKLEWLFEELQNTPEPIKYSKALYGDFNFDKIMEERR